METVTLMVLPPVTPGALPQFLVEKNGMWRLWEKEGAMPDPEFVKETIDDGLRKVINQVIGGASASKSWYRMKQLGTKLYNLLLPTLLQDHLRAVQGADADPPLLCIHSFKGYDWIPWDLMWDGSAFLGRRFQIARLPVGTAGHYLLDEQPRLVERVYNMLGEGVLTEDHCENRWQDTFALLPAAVSEERWPSNGRAYAMPEECLEQVVEDAVVPDILHFTCQGGIENGRVYWAFKEPFLERDEWICTEDLDFIGPAIAERRPLIFGNACASAAVAQGATVSEWGVESNFGRRCLALGAVAFVGTFARVTEELAVEFACQFYHELLLNKEPVARALWNVKRSYESAGGGDPSWLFYCLYGDPGTRFELP